MFKVIVQEIQTKHHKVGCKFCGRHSEPPTYEIVDQGGKWYSCADHLGTHMEDLRHS